jgi:polysaccharide biosynthesis/export protein
MIDRLKSIRFAYSYLRSDCQRSEPPHVAKMQPLPLEPHAVNPASRRSVRCAALAAAAVVVLDASCALAKLAGGASRSGAGPASTPNASALGLDAYILGPGDKLQLTLLDPGVSNLSGTLEILNDGSASLALLGSVVLQGLTVNQASNWLRTLYGRYLLRPDLNLRVTKPRPIQVSLVGEVENPGLYSLVEGESSRTEGVASTFPGLPTVVTAIQKAGGLTLNADLTSMRLQRRLPGDSQVLREAELDLVALLRKGDKQQNPFLFDGDTILVGKAVLPDPEVMEMAATNLSPQTIEVNVIGEVVQPGRLQIKANTPLVQAILTAGGPKNWRANRNNVELVRINRNGTATRELFSVNYSQGVSGARNPPLRDGDTVVVNRNTFAATTDALDAVTRPLGNLVNAWGLIRLIQYNNN